MTPKRVFVFDDFDDLRSRHVRFLHEASRSGKVHAFLRSDKAIHTRSRKMPKFPQEERKYLLEAVRYVDKVEISPDQLNPGTLPPIGKAGPAVWAVDEESASPAKRSYCVTNKMEYRVIGDGELVGLPAETPPAVSSNRKKVVVTGCFDWFHSGHVAFFEEVAGLGDLYVIVGHDRNIELLKGKGHPLFRQEERRYMVQSIRHVTQALVSTGTGWMDAEPEIMAIEPDIYAVNEDGDVPEKREFCARHKIEYRVLKRTPKAGLPPRFSTELRGF